MNDPQAASMHDLIDGKRGARNIDEHRFLIAHKKHPILYPLFIDKTHEEMREGGGRRGAGMMIMQKMRWHTEEVFNDINPQTGEKMKVSDHHFPYMARLFMEDHPDYKDFFRIKAVKLTMSPYIQEENYAQMEMSI